MSDMIKGQGGEGTEHVSLTPRNGKNDIDSFVLEKAIFSNIFGKDIKRVYVYKKAERLAKALSLIAPAFAQAPELKDRTDRLAVALIDAAVCPPVEARETLARELLALSSILSLARLRGLISIMNADLIRNEAHLLLDEVAEYEEPRIALPDTPTLPVLSRKATNAFAPPHHVSAASSKGQVSHKGHIKDKTLKPARGEAIISVLKEKGPSDIKRISTVIRHVSEKTIQRELLTLVAQGRVLRSGSRRWTTYTLAK